MIWSDKDILAHKGKQTMTYSVVVSLVLHGALALSVLYLFSKPAEEIKADKLLIELFGMVADRQKEASAQAAAATTPTPPQKTAQAEEKTKTRHPIKALKSSNTDSPVQLAKQEDQTTPATEPSDNVKASDLQKQQTLNQQNKDIEELKKYQAKVTKKIKSNLVYPAEARKRGYEGVAVVRFMVTESGMIRSGSLAIARSSGYEMLDAYALKSARDSEPFDRPPHGLPIEIDLGFSS